jgi:hypothetical protein
MISTVTHTPKSEGEHKMQINDPATRTALEQLGCLINNQLDNEAMTRLLVTALEANHIAADLDDVPTVEISAGQLAADVVSGETKAVSMATRFLSADPAVVVRHLFDARQRRAESTVNNTLELAAMVGQRNPAMATEVQAFLAELLATWQTALTTGSNP